jgi:hypothetical protein
VRVTAVGVIAMGVIAVRVTAVRVTAVGVIAMEVKLKDFEDILCACLLYDPILGLILNYPPKLPSKSALKTALQNCPLKLILNC